MCVPISNNFAIFDEAFHVLHHWVKPQQELTIVCCQVSSSPALVVPCYGPCDRYRLHTFMEVSDFGA
jgi:hypothetical protein